MPLSLDEKNRADRLDAEELGLTLVQLRTLQQNFRAFMGNRMPFQSVARWVKGTKDEYTAQARAEYIGTLLSTELMK